MQPVLEELGPEYAEAAETLGATRWQSCCKVVLPELSPALVAGVALSFTRSQMCIRDRFKPIGRPHQAINPINKPPAAPPKQAVINGFMRGRVTP